MIFRYYRKFITAFLIGIVYQANLFALDAEQQKMLILTGNSPVHAGRGFTGVTDKYINGIMFNPASIGDEVSTSYSVNYSGYFDGFSYPSFVAVVPNRYFKTGFEYSMLDDHDTDHIDTHILRLNVGNYIGNGYYLGFGLSYYYLDIESSASHFGFTTGLQKQLSYSYTFNRNFGIYDIQTGIILSPGSFIGAEKNEYTSFTNSTLGYSFQFFRSDPVDIRFLHEVSVTVDYFQLPFKFGIESNLFNNYFLRTGMVYPDAYGYGDFTIGAGYALTRKDITGRIDYALVHKEKNDFSNYLGITFSFSSKLSDDDDLRIRLKDSNFSPNGDSVNDNITVQFDQYSNIKSWELSILDRSGKKVRQVDYRTTGQNTIIERVLATEASFQLPEQYIWDGRNNSGEICADGLYYAELTVVTDNGRRITKRTGTFVLDNVKPEAKVQINERIFVHDSNDFIIEHTVLSGTGVDDNWVGSIIRKSDNKVVRSFNWKGKDLPDRMVWDGKDNSGDLVEEGVYMYRLEGEDLAGNSIKREIDSILVVAKIMRVDMVSLKDNYSKKDKHAEFVLYIPRRDLISRYEINIIDNNGETVSNIRDHDNVEYLRYNFDENLDDGQYKYFLKVYYSTGDNPESAVKSFNLDTTDPVVSVNNYEIVRKESLELALRLYFNGKDKDEVGKYTVNVYNKNKLIGQYSRIGALPDYVDVPVSNTTEPSSFLTYSCNFYDRAGNITTVNGKGPYLEPDRINAESLSYRINLKFNSDGSISELSKSHLTILLNDLDRRSIKISGLSILIKNESDSKVVYQYVKDLIKLRGYEVDIKIISSDKNIIIAETKL